MNGFSTEEDSRDGPPAAPFYGQSCCLIDDGDRCVRPAGNASFSKRIQKSISQKKLKLDIDKSVRHLYICDFHKNFIQSVRNKRKRKTSDDGGDSPEHDTDVPEVDLFQLQVNTLRRYKRHYKLQTRPGLNKAQLAEVSDDRDFLWSLSSFDPTLDPRPAPMLESLLPEALRLLLLSHHCQSSLQEYSGE
ncbi:histone deacetylase complex subunit SAP30L isoform X1 [Pithys albifrons albifrons]|uniref:histone deacetylase complex subunit SAP30L isoform X1 n=1 Tax=Pithys albifrons albifrons TaxID=3385563 RepID=UPI003A5D10A6